MTQLPQPLARAFDQTSHFLTDFGTWYVAQLYSLAGVFYGIFEGLFTEGKGLLLKGKETVENDGRYQEIKAKADETARSAKDSLANGYSHMTGEAPQQTKQKAQQTATDIKKDAKQTAKR